MRNDDLIKTFIDYLVSTGVSKNSLKFYKSDIVNFLKFAGSMNQINHDSVFVYLKTIKKTNSPKTYNRKLSTLRKFIGFSLDLKLMDTNPMSDIKNVFDPSKLLDKKRKTIEKFDRFLINQKISKNTRKVYLSDIEKFINWQEKTEGGVKQYLNENQNTVSRASYNRLLASLKKFYEFKEEKFPQSRFVFPKLAPYRFIQEAILQKLENRKRLQKVFEHIFLTRPKWYRRYHTYPIASYVHFAILFLFCAISGYAVYDNVIIKTQTSLAYPATPETPNKFLSFQGRLTDELGNPITGATNVVFKLYSVSSGGVALWDSTACSITPDSDGIFSTLLGSSCGGAIDSSVFSENADIWLGVTVGGDSEATPRIQIATVAYALNSETLQGFPLGTGVSTVPYIDSTGKLTIASASPTIESSSGIFGIIGQATTISTANTTNGVITVNPDGTGTLDLIFEGASAGGSANGFVNATNASITSGALYGGTVASAASGYNFIDFQAGVSPASVFSVGATGLTTVGADLYASSGISLYNNAVSDDTIEAAKFCTGDGESNCVTDFSSLASGASIWTDGGAYIYPTNSETLGNSTTGEANKIAGLYLADSAPLTLGTDNDVSLAFSGTTLAITQGNNDINFDSDTLFIDGSANNVGIGTTSPGAKLMIDGSADDQQLIVQAHSTQTANLTEWQNSSGTVLTNIDENGSLGINVANPAYKADILSAITDTSNVQVVQAVGRANNASGTIAAAYGLNFLLTKGGAGDLTEGVGILGTGIRAYSGAGGTVASVVGARLKSAQLDSGSTTNITNAKALEIMSATDAGGGAITNSYGIYVNTQTAAATSNYGIYMADLSGATANYAIYTNLGDVRFGDEVVIASPTAPALTIGAGTADIDYQLKFDGETSDGILTWMEDEDYFQFADKVLLDDKLMFTQTDGNEYIDSLADGYLDLAATTGIRLTSPLTSATGDFAIGGTTLAASMFGVDESAGNFYLGYDNSANPTLNFEATDGDAGEFGFNTNDAFYITNSKLGIGDTSPDHTLDVTGNIGLDASGYINWGDTDSESGYGVRDNAGTLEYKNSGGSWAGIGSGGSSSWTDGGTYLYPTDGEVLGNSTTGEANKIAGLYLTDSAPLTFGTDNDVSFAFSDTTLAITQGNNDINFDSNTLFVDGSANNVGIGTTSPSTKLEINHATGDNLRLTYNDADGSATAYTDFSLASDGDLTIDSAGGAINFSGDDISNVGTLTATTGILVENLQVNNSAAVSYNRFGTNTTSHVGNITDGDDLLISSDLELDGVLYLDGANISNSEGTAFISFASNNLYLNSTNDITILEDPTIQLSGTNPEISTTGSSLVLDIAGTDELTLTASALSPSTSDSNALGTTTNMWSDLFLASGGIVNFDNGDVTLTHSSNTLALAGGTGSITYDDATNDDITNVLTLAHTTSGTAAGGSSDSYTKSLIHADAADGTAGITDETGKTWTANGNAQTDTAQSKFGGSAMLFDGTEDYFDTPDSDDWDVGSGDFTVEFWARRGATGVQHNIFGQWDGGGVSSVSFDGFFYSDNKFYAVIFSGSTGYQVDSTSTFGTTSWNHIAFVRDGNTLRLFVNGVQEDTANVTGVTANNSSTKMSIGRIGEGAVNCYNGWIDEFRFSKGIARYTTTGFTPPSAELTYSSGDDAALLHMNGTDGSTTFTDQSGKAWVANGNVQIDTAQSMFGGASGLFDGTGDYLTGNSSSDFAFGTEDFTVELWYRANSIDVDFLYDSRPTGTQGYYPTIYIVSNKLLYYTNSSNVITGTTTLTTGTWYHIALSRSSGVTRLFLNGTQEGSIYSDSNTYLNGSSRPIIGEAGNATGYVINGWIDELRVTKGIGHYTHDFTLETSPFEYNTNTGIGTGLLFKSEDADGNAEDAARIAGTLVTATNGSEDSSIVFETRSDGGALARAMRLWHTGNLTISGWISQNSNPDVAENVIVTDPSITAGDVVMLDPSFNPSGQDIYNRAAVKKADTPYSPAILGVISTDPGIILNAPESGIDNQKRSEDNERPLTLTGRVPVNIDPDSESFEPGDFLTASDKPGLATKATQAGYIIGKAMQSWPLEETDNSQALVFIQPGYHDPDVFLNKEGYIYNPNDVNIASEEHKNYKLSFTEIAGNIIKKIGIFKKVETNLITPIADTDLIIDLDPKNASSSARLAIKGIDDEIVTLINAEGKITSNALETKEATISGTLYANDIKSEKLEEIEKILHEVESNQKLLADADNWETDTDGNPNILSEYGEIDTIDIFATGTIAGNSVLASISLNIGNDFILNDNSINTFINPLKIQSLAVAGIEIMSGKIVIDTQGNMTINGNLDVAGNVATQKILIANSEEEVLIASQSAEIKTNATAGKGILPAGKDNIKISNQNITEDTLIYITPLSDTHNNVLYVKSKEDGEFTVGFNNFLEEDIEFNWWVIDLKEKNM